MRVPSALFALALVLASPATATSQSSPKDDGVWTTVTVLARPVAAPRQAPADEYFGPERLSNLGVRNAIRDMNLEGTSPLALPEQLERIKAVEDALAIWSDRYPHDSWLPGTTLDFAKFLQSKDQPFTDDLALGYLIFLVQRYPSTGPGFEARSMLGSYHPMPAFDMSAAPSQDPPASVGASTFPKTRR
ncbi:MAG: hypothetical protein JO347_03155 [Candidatus Eremiobacteraeota bacterium]|nr:hypothetical protein [Candidatus Eremiobacteraeota bacterium]MBV8281047.1 hypothetical protein [Candidatus Eremiobacteraeota bacterium]